MCQEHLPQPARQGKLGRRLRLKDAGFRHRVPDVPSPKGQWKLAAHAANHSASFLVKGPSYNAILLYMTQS